MKTRVVMAYNASALLRAGNESSRTFYSDDQISKALSSLKRGAKKPEDIGTVIAGAGATDPKIAQKCRVALGKLDQSSFTESHLMSVIGMISGKGDALDSFCISLLKTMVFQTVPVFSSRPNRLAFNSHLRKQGADKLDSDYFKFLLSIPAGEQTKIYLHKPAKGDSFPYDVRKKGKRLEIGERTGATTPAFTWDCFNALLGKYCDLLRSEAAAGGFVNGISGNNHLMDRMDRILQDVSRLDPASPIAPEQAAALSGRLSDAFAVLESNPRINGAGAVFGVMENFMAKPELGIVTKAHYSSVLRLIDRYDSDTMIQEYASKNQELLSHDDIEIFKKGLTNRDAADTYAKIFRHVDRFYAKHFRKEDLDIFIDNIDQNKPEYCSGETCGCKARAIADMANVRPEMFDVRHVKVAINTFQTSSTYKDGSAMILGFLAVKEPEKFGEMCVNGLLEGFKDPVFFDAQIILLYIALNQTEKFGKAIRDAYIHGLGERNSRAGCAWALEAMFQAKPELKNGLDGPAKELIGKYPPTNRQKLNATMQYWHYDEYFHLRVVPISGRLIDDLNDAVRQENEAKKQAK